MTNEHKLWIDNASYYELLEKWRFAPVGDAFFKGDTGDYYAKVMAQRREEVGHAVAVQTSKALSP